MSRRPLGPVIRNDIPDNDEGAAVADSALQIRFEFLSAGAELAAHLTVAAREADVDAVGRAVVHLTRDQLEAACMAFALLAAGGAPVVEAE